MCGIVGYIGNRQCIEILFKGLQRLEYRGYDSAGIAVLDGRELGTVKAEGKLAQLEPKLETLPQKASRGIGHTRWATHGVPNTVNAHPHVQGNVALVHNGIIENYEELKAELVRSGARFQSETDTEVVLQLFVAEHRKKPAGADTLSVIRTVIGRLRGAFSLGILVADEPDALYVVKQGSPLVIGAGKGETFFASDAMAIVQHTTRAHFLEDGEIAKVTELGAEIFGFDGQVIPARFQELEITSASAEKQGFRHFMMKEIHEQPRVLSAMLKRFVDFERKTLDSKELGIDALDLGKITNIAMVACGTAYYSAVLGKYFVEPLCGLPVNVELASEFRYRKPGLDKSTLVIAVSQSGETADTLACIKHAKELGCQTFAVCNVKMSSIPRECRSTLYMEAGPEIGVASTKAFTAMLLAHYLFGLAVAQKKGRLDAAGLDTVVQHLRALPPLMDHAIDTKAPVEALAAKYYEATNFIFMGRGPSYAIALEGALKLKEISYIHAEGYAGGELKHGPIALIDRHMPVVAIAPQDFYYEKMVSNIEEVKARQGRIITLGGAGDDKLKRLGDDFISCPATSDVALQAILSVVPLQLLAYYVAVKRGTDVDQPRNLAKSVTVE
jgi:glucosamine--fructose-6-phosphate aminotransferase (isomerizing)